MKYCTECNQSFLPTSNRQLTCKNCSIKRQSRLKKEKRQADPRIREKNKLAVIKYRNNNRDKIRLQEKEIYKRNSQKFIQKVIRYHQKNINRYNKYQREWRYKNKEHCKNWNKERYNYINVRQKRQKLSRNYYYNNTEKCLQRNKDWRTLHPEFTIANNLKKRTREKIDPVLIKKIFELHNYTCLYCGKYGGVLHLEHKIPLSRGGDNSEFNLAVACAKCNFSKNNKIDYEFMEYRRMRLLRAIKC